MRTRRSIVGAVTVLVMVALALGMLVTPGEVLAKKPAPPPCPCPETIDLGNGIVCVLEACGFDCVYTCPLPF